MTRIILKTNTELRKNSGVAELYTYYVRYNKNIIFFIAETDILTNNIGFKQGELGYTNSDWINTYFILNEKGELIIVSDEADKFSINNNGELEYTDMAETRNLGQVSAFEVGVTPPTNTQLLWLDTSLPIPLHKIYNPTTSQWEAFLYLTLIDNYTIKKDEEGRLYVDTATIPELQIGEGSVSLNKLANVPSGTVFYRKSVGDGIPELQSLAILKQDLGLTGTNSGDQDLSNLVSKSTTINNKSLSGNITLFPSDIGSPTGTGNSTGTNTGDETQNSILSKLNLLAISGTNTGDETYNRILTLFGLTGEGYTLLSSSQASELTESSKIKSITLPSASTVAGRIAAAIEGTDYPTEWTLSTGESEYDLLITHNLTKKVCDINVFSVDINNKERILRPFNNAYSGFLVPDSNSVLIEAITDIESKIKIYISLA